MMLPIMGGLTSCEDQPDKFEFGCGTPTISYIRMPYLSQSDSLIDKASLSSVVCLVGDNLDNIKALYFNDQKAQLNTSYITKNTLLVQIPSNIPDVVSDKIYMVTSGNDTVSYDFHVVVPKPEISSMSCEMAKEGTEVTIYGNYFVSDPSAPLTVTLPNGKIVTDQKNYNGEASDNVSYIKSYTDGTITFVMPKCDIEGPMTVTSIYGQSESTFHYLDSRGLLFDFDTKGLTQQGWKAIAVTTDDTALDGNFGQFGTGSAKMNGTDVWDDTNFFFQYWCGDWNSPQNITSGSGIALNNYVDFTNWEKMALKFEMYIPTSNPWTGGAMQICFLGVDKVTLSGNPIDGFSTVKGATWDMLTGEDKGWGRAFYRPWYSTGTYDTNNKWETVTIPLTSLTCDVNGGTATSTPSKPEDFASLMMQVLYGGGTDCYPIIKVDNIRVVPNK